MTTKRICDICKEDIGIRWFELIRHHKEMDHGIDIGEGTYDVCSKTCLEKLMNKIKEFTKDEKMYDY